MKKEAKDRARVLREQGWSVKGIAKELEVAPSSVSVWVRDIKLTDERKEILLSDWKLKKCHLKASEANKLRNAKRREEFRQLGMREAETSEALRLIAALYWGEGAKTTGQFSFSNSDPAMIKLVISWFKMQNFSYRLCVYSHVENSLTKDQILDWWKEQTGVLPLKWYPQRISRASQSKNIGKLPYGTCRIDANIQSLLMVLGAIEVLKQKSFDYGLVV